MLIILGILGYLYLKTDAFKSKETLFAKYLAQNFNSIEILKTESDSEIENMLNTNKYESQLEGTIEYTEDIGTSNENKNSNINNVGIKIKSNVDKVNNYDYKDISIENKDERLVGFKYLNEENLYGIKLDGIQQFVSNNTENQTSDDSEINSIKKLTSGIDINSILNFTEEEKQTLANTYVGIIQSNISKDKYYKQSNALITVNNKDIQTNAYYIKITIEEYNNLYIKILQQITNDEIILSRIDLIENQIKEKDSNYNESETLREKFIKSINDKIEEIKNNNIGNEEVKITVYENNMKTVRTSIEKTTEKLTIDMYNNSYIKIDRTKIGDTTEEEFIKIEKNENQNIVFEYEQLQDNEIIHDIQINYQQTLEDNKLDRTMQFTIANEKYKATLRIKDNTKIVQEFENQITLENNNVKLDELQQEQKDRINQILNENIQQQLSNLFSKVSLQDYTTMLQNLSVIEKKSVQLPTDGQVTDIERKRFNSQFEFFVSQDLTTDNIKELIKTAESNFDDMKILTKNGQIEELNTEKLLSTSQESTDYKKTISEILIYLKQNSSNEEKQKDTLSYIENNKNNKYTVSIEYDENGLAKIIRIKIQE
jgi:hypothetical protein